MRIIEGVNNQAKFKTIFEKRPWGFFRNFANNKKCTVKILHLKPKQSLSLQFHYRREQLYYIMEPVIIQYSIIPFPYKYADDRLEVEKFIKENVMTFSADSGDMFAFRKFYLHRAINPSPMKEIRILDVAFGKNDESDIIRLKDEYGRADVMRLRHA